MGQASRILDQLHRAYQGPAWHGPALAEILPGITAGMAARRPIPGAHTIWEIVLHLTVWMSVPARRLQGETLASLPPDQDWPPVTDSSEAAWQRSLVLLANAEGNLEAEVRELSDDRLDEIVLGDRPHSIYTLLHGVIQHNLYHAGQIALLKKLASAGPLS